MTGPSESSSVAATAPQHSTQVTTEELLRQGEFRHMRCNNLIGAIEDFSQAIAREGSARCWYARGVLQLKLGAKAEAMADFKAAVHRDPTMTLAWHQLALLHQNQKEWAETLEAYTTILAHQPDDTIALTNRAQLALTQHHNTDSAIDDFRLALGVDARCGAAWEGRALLYAMNLHDPTLAVQDFTAALSIKPCATTYTNRGSALMQLGRYQEALLDYTRALHLDVKAITHYNRALAYTAVGQIRAALDDYTSALRHSARLTLAPTADWHVLRGALLCHCEEYPAAMSDFQAALHLEPRHPEARSKAETLHSLLSLTTLHSNHLGHP
eukprot:NODE_2597_length_1140_cov_36.055281_g2477_i0.p1 GENE.NODE_2597_length_1140_cov_36.055281_g2477_i0~~NODE_2597_length_1140_cov_36.055281_g2477_i0.p1  ORF type:complete len:339 (-),score=68.82 NODE_2597_length_1140_cov_36.055281_g2477_i0:123-1103(-)